jgi:hypothetical protein
VRDHGATIAIPAAYDNLAVAVMRLLAHASVTLAGIEVWRKL